jgi:hypothetical protein
MKSNEKQRKSYDHRLHQKQIQSAQKDNLTHFSDNISGDFDSQMIRKRMEM